MNLYSIRFIHYAPKDRQEGILGYVLSESEENIYEWLKINPKINGFTIYCNYQYEEDKGYDYDIYSENYMIIGKEKFKEKIIRLGGQMYDEDADISDSYYGVTHYGWKLEREIIDDDDISILMDYFEIKVL